MRCRSPFFRVGFGLESTLTLGPVELMSDVLARCEALMQQGKVHFVLAHAHARMHGSLDSDAYLSARIGGDRLVAVSKAASGGRPVHPLGKSTREPVPVLAYSDESGLGRIVRSVLGRRLEAIPVDLVFTAHLASVLRSMALDGRGVAWLPRTLVEEDLQAGSLVAAAGDDWNVDLEIRLYRPREAVGRAAEAFWKSANSQPSP